MTLEQLDQLSLVLAPAGLAVVAGGVAGIQYFLVRRQAPKVARYLRESAAQIDLEADRQQNNKTLAPTH